MNTNLTIENLHKSYPSQGEEGGDLQVLKDLNFSAQPREFVVVMGSSGSGKTTLLHLVGALDHPDSGKIVVGDQNITEFSRRDKIQYRRTTVGYIFQSFNLIPSLNAVENVELPLLYAGISLKEGRERARDALEKVGLKDRMKHRPAMLSGGEQQRVATARALIHRPTLLLADEPTGNLDTKNAQYIIDLFKEIKDIEDQTILLVTHDPQVAKEADRIIHLQDGVFVSEEANH